MRTLADVRRELSAGEFEFSRHAFRRAVERNISEQDIRKPERQPKSLRTILKTNILPARCCWDSRRLDGLCISRYLLRRRL